MNLFYHCDDIKICLHSTTCPKTTIQLKLKPKALYKQADRLNHNLVKKWTFIPSMHDACAQHTQEEYVTMTEQHVTCWSVLILSLWTDIVVWCIQAGKAHPIITTGTTKASFLRAKSHAQLVNPDPVPHQHAQANSTTNNLCAQKHTGTTDTHVLTDLPRAKQGPCTSHLILFIVQRRDSSVANAPTPAEAGGNSQSFRCFQASCLCLITLTLCTYPLLCSLFMTSSLLWCLSLSFFALLTLYLLPLLSDLSFSLVQRLHNAHQLFRGSLPVSPAYPIRARLCANGLQLYLLPAPTHSQDSGGVGVVGGREIDRGSSGDSPGGREVEKKIESERQEKR